MGLRLLTPFVLLLLFALGCSQPSRGAAGAAEILYVATGVTGAITRIDASNGRPIGSPFVAGSAAWSLIPSPHGGVLALPFRAPRPGALPHVRPMPGRSSTWELLHLSIGNARLAEAVIAGDGGRYALAIAPTPTKATGAQSCRLSVLDLIASAVVREHELCAPRDTGYSLAPGPSATEFTAAVAYVGVWHAATPATPGMVGSGAINTVRLDTGSVLRRFALRGVPTQLVLAPQPGRTGLRLYCVERWPGPEEWNPRQPGAPTPEWRLLAMDPLSLAIEDAWLLADEPRSLVVAPDGVAAYALVAGPTPRQSAVIEIDLTTGSSQRVVLLPGLGVSGLAATRERVFAPHSLGSEVWAIDRRQRRIVQVIPVAPRPTAAAIGR